MSCSETTQRVNGLSQIGRRSADDPQAEGEAEALDTLALAAKRAVAESQEGLEVSAARLGEVLSEMQAVADSLFHQRIGEEVSGPAQGLADALQQSRDAIEDLLGRQRVAQRTFNIVLFGRTGAGKSSIITALMGGDGEIISQGESDWTTDVRPLAWNSCLIYDTPGISGWGRTRSRELLEEQARKAVEVADLVLVCFDTQSQLNEEFDKLAAWVTRYRKPLVAVLNARNAMWRMPDRVPQGLLRATQSRAIAEHAGNVRDELGRLGLVDVPLLAVSSKRAAVARAGLPFKGPDLEGFTKQRELYGCASLETWSNYGRFERLLVHAIGEHAAAFRLGALDDQLRGILEGLHHRFGLLGADAEVGAETIERKWLAPCLELVGYPSRDDAEHRAAVTSDGTDLLEELERRRGGVFQATSEGEYMRMSRRSIEVGFAALRSNSLREAEACIMEAFASRTLLDSESLRRRCFDELAMQRLAEQSLSEGLDYLREKAALAGRSTKFALNLRVDSSGVSGGGGTAWKHSAWSLKAGGILVGLAGTFGAVAATNFWNPLGWGAGLAASVSLVGGLSATLLGWLGGKAHKKAERTTLEARRAAMADLRKTIHSNYDDVVRRLMKQVRQTAVAASADLLPRHLRQALDLRHIRGSCDELRTVLDRQLADRPAQSHPQALLWEMARRLEQAAFPGLANASALHWLGEDWIDDPRGLLDAKTPARLGRPEGLGTEFPKTLFGGLDGVFGIGEHDVTARQAEAWLEEVTVRCETDLRVHNAVAELRALLADGRPRIYLVGDYNAGKSSFIRRLLIEAGLPVPASLEIAARPTTAVVSEYDCHDFVLVDAPGFQGSDPAHAAATLLALPDASAVIFLFQPNLIVGDGQFVRTVLLGDPGRGSVAKRDRTLFVVNRADELGVDPEMSPNLYLQLVARKRLELVQALASLGVDVDGARIVFMASDPYGLAGNFVEVDASAFDPYRAWDGFDQFCAALQRARLSLLRFGITRSVLEGGIARLARLASIRATEVESGTQAMRESERVLEAVCNMVDEGKRIGDQMFAGLNRLVSDFVSAQKEDILREADMTALRTKAEALSQWWTDPALQVEIGQWQDRSAEALEVWRMRGIDLVSRRMDSVGFRQVRQKDLERSGPIPGDARGKGAIFEAVDKIGRSLSGATRDVVYGTGKFLGFKFRPWGAVKLARSLAKFGAVIAAVGVVLDFVFLFVEEKRLKQREEARRKLADFLLKSSHEVVQVVSFGSGAEQGLLHELGDMLSTLERHVYELRGAVSVRQEEVACERQQIEVYAALATSAREHLEGRKEQHA